MTGHLVSVCSIRPAWWGQMISCLGCFPLNSPKTAKQEVSQFANSRGCLSPTWPLPDPRLWAQTTTGPKVEAKHWKISKRQFGQEEATTPIWGGNRRGVWGVKVFRRRLYLSPQINWAADTHQKRENCSQQHHLGIFQLFGDIVPILGRFLQDHECCDAWEN